MLSLQKPVLVGFSITVPKNFRSEIHEKMVENALASVLVKLKLQAVTTGAVAYTTAFQGKCGDLKFFASRQAFSTHFAHVLTAEIPFDFFAFPELLRNAVRNHKRIEVSRALDVKTLLHPAPPADDFNRVLFRATRPARKPRR
ncbi:MAG: hypothetical protein QW343_00160 [Candidatus Norongarragalinales archaeon]